MIKIKNIVVLFLSISLIINFLITDLLAQQYPSKPIQIVVPWPAGGETDLSTRIAATGLSAQLGQPIVVLNKAGGGAILGMDFVAKASPDGYTLLGHGATTITIPMVQETSFSLSDFIPLVEITRSKAVILVQKDAPWQDFKEFVADIKKRPGFFKYGTPARGAWPDLKLEYMKLTYGIDIVGVPFAGNAQVITALIGGHTTFGLIGAPQAFPHIKGGTMKALAIAERDDDFPGVKTFEEQGFQGNFNNWCAIWAPKGIPADRLKIIEDAGKKMLADSSYIDMLKKVGNIPGTLAGDSLREFVREEEKEFRKVVEKVFTK